MTTVEITPEKYAALEATVDLLRSELAEKTTIIEALLRRFYGPKSERLDPDQLGLFDPEKKETDAATPQAMTTPIPAPPIEKKKPGHGRTTFPDRLPRETTVTDLDEKDCTCSTCGAMLKSIGVDTCERGHIQPVKVIIKRHVAHKYACPNGHEVKTSEGAPKGLVDRAKWTTESYVHIALSKFQDHQPLERIEKSLNRHGIELPTSTMNSMVDVVAEKVAPIVEQGKREIRAENHIEADATGIATFCETPAKSPGSKPTKRLQSGFFWVWKAREKLLVEFHRSGGSAAALDFLKGWVGTLLVDGSSSFDAAVLASEIIRAGCWAHARRKLKEAFDLGVADAVYLIRLIARLYRIESAIKKRLAKPRSTDPTDDELCRRVRKKQCPRVMKKIDAEIRRLRADVRPLAKSPLGKALTYLENQWLRLQVYVNDPKVAIDNNAVERAIRPIAVGRRNYGFAGSERGARNAAVLYSIVNTCIALGINAYDYLVDVLEQVSPNADLSRLTPWAWAARRNAAATAVNS